MGIVSVEKANHLYWLGRYTERVFTTLKGFISVYSIFCTPSGAVLMTVWRTRLAATF